MTTIDVDCNVYYWLGTPIFRLFRCRIMPSRIKTIVVINKLVYHVFDESVVRDFSFSSIVFESVNYFHDFSMFFYAFKLRENNMVIDYKSTVVSRSYTNNFPVVKLNK